MYRLLTILVLLLMLVLPAAAQAPLNPSPPQPSPLAPLPQGEGNQAAVVVEPPSDDAGPAATTEEAAPDTVGDVVDDLVDAGEVALLEWYARQTERTQMILLAVVVAFGGVLTAVVFRGDARFAAVLKQFGATIDKLEDKALEAALKTPTVWDEQIVRLLIAFGDVIMPPKDVGAAGAAHVRAEVEADG